MLRRATFVLTATLLASTAVQTVAATGPVVITPGITVQSLDLGTSTRVLSQERMVGVTWTSGAPTVSVRWRTTVGWSPWEEAEDDTAEEGTPGTAPQWRPAGATLVQVKATGTARGLKLVRVTDGVARATSGLRALGLQGSVAQAASSRPVLGVVNSRADWGADESIVRSAPSYARRVSAVVLHHTAGRNGYRQAEVPAILRADYAYHVKTRGWNDLGYNLVVDQFGGVWEGRRGGLDRAVIGTHASGFNTGTLGVSVIGDFTRTESGRAIERALARVIAWSGKTWGFDPSGTVQLTSKGSPRYPSGSRPTLGRVFAHGETGQTACPGSLQAELPALRKLAAEVLLAPPTIVRTTLSGVPLHAPEPAVLEGALSRAVPWKAVLSDPRGLVVASAFGTGTKPRVEWDGLERDGLRLPADPGTYRWKLSIDGGSYHPSVVRSGTFEVGLPFIR